MMRVHQGRHGVRSAEVEVEVDERGSIKGKENVLLLIICPSAFAESVQFSSPPRLPHFLFFFFFHCFCSCLRLILASRKRQAKTGSTTTSLIATVQPL
jgi:hypothetical protein